MSKPIRYFLAAVLPVLWLVAEGCHDQDKYLLNQDKVDSLFTLKAVPDSLPADGFSTAHLKAQIHDISEGSKSIRFFTSAGTLRFGATTHADSMTVLANSNGGATVDLVSSRQIVTARVLAVVVGVTPSLVQEEDIRFVPISASDIIEFTDPPASAPADGVTLSRLTVKISPHLQGADRKVKFETTAGKFSQNDTKTVVVPVNADSSATVYLRSPDRIIEAFVTATAEGFAQTVTIDFTPVSTESIIRFTGDIPTFAPADGVTLSPFTVEISPALVFTRERF